MSMTMEEAFKQYEEWRNLGFGHSTMPSSEVLVMAMDALRPVTREQVEQVWRGEWEEERFAGELEGWQHRECGRHSTEKSMWCPKCGKAMTDKAVDMVMERMEAMKDGNSVKR